MADATFSDLIGRARQGEQEAARLLVEQYESAIRRHVRFTLLDNRLRRVLDETDVCQSVLGRFFVGLWAGRFQIDGPEQLVAILKTLVKNKVVDQARYWKAERRNLQRNCVAIDQSGSIDVASAQPTPSRIVSDAELLREFERRLNGPERSILALRREGLSWAEIAERVAGGGAEATRKRFERAVERVSRVLGLDD
jgi:DNA-directed RNA polymerase specialized sigma24 family protein